jgi:hypothetical protein
MRCGSHYNRCMKLAACFSFALMIVASTTAAAAAEQCRFIEARPEREACYKRQDAERAARQKADEAKQVQQKPYEPVSQEDALLAKSLRSICRGC